MKKSLFIYFLSIGLISCSSYTHQTPKYQPPPTPPTPPTSTHEYELLITDLNDRPLQDATIAYTFKDHGDLVKDSTIISQPNGTVYVSVQATLNPLYRFVRSYNTELDYKITKEGYYLESGHMFSGFGSEITLNDKPKQTKKVVLIRPIDYLNPWFAASSKGVALKAKILTFIDLILLESILADSYLEPRSISLINFKNKNYLQFKFNNPASYNSLKMSKYDIGKRLFDEVVRKVLSPLNEHISNPRMFFGYDMTVIGFTKSFANEYESPEQIEYRFMIPQLIVKRYKNKDISGQQVLNSSVILMNDERIELKLQ